MSYQLTVSEGVNLNEEHYQSDLRKILTRATARLFSPLRQAATHV